MISGLSIGLGNPLRCSTEFQSYAQMMSFFPCLTEESYDSAGVRISGIKAAYITPLHTDLGLQFLINYLSLDSDGGQAHVDEYVRAFCMYLMGVFFFPFGHSTISLGYLANFEHLNELGGIDFGGAIYCHLLRCLDRASRQTGVVSSLQMGGFVILLEVWFYEYFRVANPILTEYTDERPRLRAWHGPRRARLTTGAPLVKPKADSVLRLGLTDYQDLFFHNDEAYDTLSWDFLWDVLKKYGLSGSFINWISNIMSSANLSILINGTVGFFKLERGVGKDNPLSLILFALAEDVLSRGISKLHYQHKILPTLTLKGQKFPSHLFFVDDILIFFNGHMRNIRQISNFLYRYQEACAVGHNVNKTKSNLLMGNISLARRRAITEEMGIEEGCFLEKNLGVPLVKGKFTSANACSLLDKIRKQLGRMLSFQGRCVLIKVVISSIPFITCPFTSGWSLLLKWQRGLFIISYGQEVDPQKRNIVIVNWDKVCKPYEEGGLGI
ncbi:hypothetical protein IFM89_014445 [Coptis chinensis]|uniref:Aminotransferase-like plant mobile domain-containing protein n=1 Tax=Coptis chinensis TaxID=261450 RepID=A0A835M3E2_9MAGN|nr:hypothetical protein IFM89_014445 [Coptis chinensis]